MFSTKFTRLMPANTILHFSRGRKRTRGLKLTSLVTEKRRAVATQFYDYFFVLDFEATCEDDNITRYYPQEIIEFPVFKVNSKNFEIESEFHSYVRPTINPTLSTFCSRLTGISQVQIDKQKPLGEVLKKFEKWMNSEVLQSEKSFIFATSGDWDLNEMLQKECQMKNIDMPKHFTPYININKSFAYATGKWPRYGKGRIQAMLTLLGLSMDGKLHQGTSDCKNIINIMHELATCGYVFKATSEKPGQHSESRFSE